MLPKFFFYSITLLLLTTRCIAQDTIYTQNDQRIPCKVIEVTSTEVKYKRWELIEGPIYIESKSLVVRIKYANGFVDTFAEERAPVAKANDNPGNHAEQKKYPDLDVIAGERTFYLYDGRLIGESSMHDFLLSLNNLKIREQVDRAGHSKKLGYLGFLAIPFGVAGIICAANTFGIGGLTPYTGSVRKDYATASVLFGSAAALSIAATIHFDISNRKANQKAIQLYRQAYLGQ